MSKLSAVFKEALKRIESGEDEFICSAIEDSEGESYIKIEATEIVMSRLDGRYTYTSWIKQKHPYLWVVADYDHKKAREGRIAWLKSLIKEFK